MTSFAVDGGPRWYAVWTRSRHEKSVSEHFSGKAVEYFLPVYSAVRRWKNGDHRIELPLFPGYTFVRIQLKDRAEILKTAGVVCLVGFGGSPSPLEDQEIESLRQALTAGIGTAPHPYITVGRRVQITSGPLAGREGLLVRRKNAWRVVLSIELIQRSILVDAEACSVEPLA